METKLSDYTTEIIVFGILGIGFLFVLCLWIGNGGHSLDYGKETVTQYCQSIGYEWYEEPYVNSFKCCREIPDKSGYGTTTDCTGRIEGEDLWFDNSI